MKVEYFNEYGVLIHADSKKIDEDIYQQLRKWLQKEAPNLNIQELMMLERHFIGSIKGAFADNILRKQMQKKKEQKGE